MLHLRCIRRAGAAPRPCGLHFVSAVRLCAFCALTAKAASGKKRLRRAYVKRRYCALCRRIAFNGQMFQVKKQCAGSVKPIRHGKTKSRPADGKSAENKNRYEKAANAQKFIKDALRV